MIPATEMRVLRLIRSDDVLETMQLKWYTDTSKGCLMVDPPQTVELETNHFQASCSSLDAPDGQRQSGSGKERKYNDCCGMQQDLFREKEVAGLHRQAFGLPVIRHKVHGIQATMEKSLASGKNPAILVLKCSKMFTGSG